MAKKGKTVVEETPAKKSRAPGLPRMSITLSAKLRKAIRIAAAKADMEIGDWCKTVLVTAANKAVHRLYPKEYDEHGRPRKRVDEDD